MLILPGSSIDTEWCLTQVPRCTIVCQGRGLVVWDGVAVAFHGHVRLVRAHMIMQMPRAAEHTHRCGCNVCLSGTSPSSPSGGGSGRLSQARAVLLPYMHGELVAQAAAGIARKGSKRGKRCVGMQARYASNARLRGHTSVSGRGFNSAPSTPPQAPPHHTCFKGLEADQVRAHCSWLAP